MWCRRRSCWVFAALLIASPFLDYQDRRLTALGPILADHNERVAICEAVAKIMRVVERLPPAAVIVAGYRLPAIEVAGGGKPGADRRYIYLLKNRAQFDRMRGEDRNVYYVDHATEIYQARVNGLQLSRIGARHLPYWDDVQR